MKYIETLVTYVAETTTDLLYNQYKKSCMRYKCNVNQLNIEVTSVLKFLRVLLQSNRFLKNKYLHFCYCRIQQLLLFYRISRFRCINENGMV
jgi:hypothetical protein